MKYRILKQVVSIPCRGKLKVAPPRKVVRFAVQYRWFFMWFTYGPETRPYFEDSVGAWCFIKDRMHEHAVASRNVISSVVKTECSN